MSAYYKSILKIKSLNIKNSLKITNFKLKIEKLTLLTFLLIFAVSFLLFYPSLNYYFFQDDWFVLNWVRTGNLLSFFEFRTDIIYWRPLSMPLFFWLGRSLFDLNPRGFHTMALLFHFVNILLIGHLSFLIFKNKKAKLITMALYATASFHFMSLSWLSLTWNTIGFMFFILSLILYLNFKKTRSIYNAIGTLALFLFALASNEFAILFTAAVLTLDFIFNERFNFSYFKNHLILILSIFITAIYLVLRIFISPIPSQGEYSIATDQRMLKNLLWYILWLFNLPEELKYQIVLSKLQITHIFWKAAKDFFPYILILLLINLLIIFRILTSIMSKKIFKLAIAAFLLLVIGLVPVLILPSHSFPYYLTISSFMVFIFLGHAFSLFMAKSKEKNAAILTSLVVVTWITSSWITISLNRKIHWITAEQNLSREYVDLTKDKYPLLPFNLAIEISDSNKQIIQSLMDQNAFQVIYNSDEVKTFYK